MGVSLFLPLTYMYVPADDSCVAGGVDVSCVVGGVDVSCVAGVGVDVGVAGVGVDVSCVVGGVDVSGDVDDDIGIGDGDSVGELLHLFSAV